MCSKIAGTLKIGEKVSTPAVNEDDLSLKKLDEFQSRLQKLQKEKYLFESTKDISVLSCGHTIHLDCLKEMGLHLRFSCPICSKSVCDMSGVWKKLDQEVASTPMAAMYQNKMIWILCNDYGTESNIHFHIVAHKCPGCNSYNTRQTSSGGPAACSRVSRELR